MKGQVIPAGDVLMYENPGDELYFGEVYRQVLQEAWLPEGAQEWMRLGKSRRGHRPTQRGITAHSPSHDQAFIRLGFSTCASAWRSLPTITPNDPPCDGRKGKDYWWDQKLERGVMCSYYDLFMRHCMSWWVGHTCIPAIDYKLNIRPGLLEDVICNGVYPLDISGNCGSVTMYQGPGDFDGSNWTAPPCAKEGILGFKDGNGATGCSYFVFDPLYFCDEFIWPEGNPDQIDKDDSVFVSIEGGVPPFSWTISGTGFSLNQGSTTGRTNTVITSPTACGTGEIEVTDTCDNKVTGAILCSEGQWLIYHECQIGISDRSCGPVIIGQYKYQIAWRKYGGIPLVCSQVQQSECAAGLGGTGYTCADLHCADSQIKDGEGFVVRGMHIWQWRWEC